jgi:hypothetical protein
MYRTLIIVILGLEMLGQPARAQNHYVGQATGTALTNYIDTINGNGISTVYAASATVDIDLETVPNPPILPIWSRCGC